MAESNAGDGREQVGAPGQERPKKWLWMLVCDDGFCHELVPFYAVCEAEAERQARDWLSKQTRALTFVEMRPYHSGFVIRYRRLPGWIRGDCGAGVLSRDGTGISR